MVLPNELVKLVCLCSHAVQSKSVMQTSLLVKMIQAVKITICWLDLTCNRYIRHDGLGRRVLVLVTRCQNPKNWQL